MHMSDRRSQFKANFECRDVEMNLDDGLERR